MRRCWGLSAQGLEPLSEASRAHLAGRVRGQWRRMAAAALVTPASLGLAYVAMETLPTPMNAMVGLFGFGMLLPAAGLLATGDAWSRARALGRDLARGEVEVFSGTIGVALGADDALEAVLADRSLAAPEGEHRVEVLPGSGLLHALDGQHRTDFLRPDVLDVASIRPPRPLTGTASSATRTIALTDKERAELRTRSAQWWRTPGSVLFVLGYFALGLFASRIGGADWWSRYGLHFGLVGIAAIAAVLRMILRVRTAIRLARDAERGEALEIVEPDEKGELHRVVVLTDSGMVWSVDDLPAEWRSDRA